MSKIILASYAVSEQTWLESSGKVTIQVHNGDEADGDVTRSVNLFTAHDVRALRPEVITARFPAPNARAVPLDYFPHIELRPADLPWRYSVQSDKPPEPWMMLIVCPASAVQVKRGEKGIMTMTWAEKPALPDPADRAFWAHAQLGAGDKPERARLLCPIRLSPNTLYIAALVPATLGGVQAALGQAVTAKVGAVWKHATAGLVLPAFDLWRFQTTDVSLEEVARALRAYDGEVDGGARLGQRSMQVRWPPGSNEPEIETGTFSGALVETPPALEPAMNAAARLFPSAQVNPAVREDDLGPAIGPIRYGAPWAQATAGPSLSGVPWTDTVNLNPGMRAAAGLGRALVVEHQEELVAAAWDKLAEVRNVNHALGRAELAEFAVAATFRLRLKELTPDKLASLGLRARGRLMEPKDKPQKSVHQQLMESAVPAGVEDPALVRRALRGGVASQRRIERRTEKDDDRPTVAGVATAGCKAILGTAAAALINEELSSTLNFVGSAFENWAKNPLIDGPFTRMGSRVSGGDDEGVESRRWAIELNIPLAPWLLQRHGTEPLVPGLESLPDDSVLMLNVNSAFVEALLVGANQALMEELIWRDVPARPGDSPLRCFWSSKAADIPPMNKWLGALGRQSSTGSAGSAVILRSRLISLIPGLTLRLVPLRGSSKPVEPLWSLPLGGDTLAAGFALTEAQLRGYAFVLEQPRTDPRFGVDSKPGTEGGFVLADEVGKNVKYIKQLPLRVLYSTKTLFGG
jgi:hypothetical protein